jgi:hypothetical protein
MKRIKSTVYAFALIVALSSSAFAGNIGGLKTDATATGNIGGLLLTDVTLAIAGNIGGMLR